VTAGVAERHDQQDAKGVSDLRQGDQQASSPGRDAE